MLSLQVYSICRNGYGQEATTEAKQVPEISVVAKSNCLCWLSTVLTAKHLNSCEDLSFHDLLLNAYLPVLRILRPNPVPQPKFRPFHYLDAIPAGNPALWLALLE